MTHPLRMMACLAQHRAHIVRWKGYTTVEGACGGWTGSKCVWCRATPDQLEHAGSFPFFNVGSDGGYRILGPTHLPKSGRGKHYPLSFLAAYGLTWQEIKDK